MFTNTDGAFLRRAMTIEWLAKWPEVLGLLGVVICEAAERLGYAWPTLGDDELPTALVLFKAKGANISTAGEWVGAMTPAAKAQLKRDLRDFSNFRPLGGVTPELLYMRARFPQIAADIDAYDALPRSEKLAAINALTKKASGYWDGCWGIWAKMKAKRTGEAPSTSMDEDISIMLDSVLRKLSTDEGRQLLDSLSEPSPDASGKRMMRFYVAEMAQRRFGRAGKPNRWCYQGAR